MEFNPLNTIIQLCMQGMKLEEMDQPEQAAAIFFQAWNEATNDFEKFLAAWYLARRQLNVSDRLQWYQTALRLALKLKDDAVKGAFPSLYVNMAKCYEELGDLVNAEEHQELALASASQPADKGPLLSWYKS